MKTEKQDGLPQGGKAITREQVGEWLKKDIGAALSLINAIHTDQDLQNSMADFMFGRLMNARNREALKAQPELPLTKMP